MIAVAIAMPADGPSFGVRAGRDVDVQVARAMEVAVDAERAGARPRVAHGGARRLLHHVAQRSGELQLAASADRRSPRSRAPRRRRSCTRGRSRHRPCGRGSGIAGSYGATPSRSLRSAERTRVSAAVRAAASPSDVGASDIPRLGLRRASLRATRPMRRSSSRTPASRVYAWTIDGMTSLSHSTLGGVEAVQPQLLAARGTGARWRTSPDRGSRTAE